MQRRISKEDQTIHNEIDMLVLCSLLALERIGLIFWVIQIPGVVHLDHGTDCGEVGLVARCSFNLLELRDTKLGITVGTGLHCEV